jgi:hypothetical protein
MKTTFRSTCLLLSLTVAAGPLLAADPPLPSGPPPVPGQFPAPPVSAAAAPAAGATGGVLSPGKRAGSLDAAKALLAGTTYPANPGQVDPFHPAGFGVQAPITSSDQPPPRDGGIPVPPKDNLLRSLAAALRPSGSFVIGGEPTLVFGQKRVKAGSTMTINFEGSAYTVEIAAVTNTTFTLRLNGEEYTRPIK